MGFRTLAVQKRSSEVWKILEAVKTEFNNFSEHLKKVDKQLTTASKSLYDLRNTRTNVMTKKLENVSTIEENEASQVLELTKSNRSNELDLGNEKIISDFFKQKNLIIYIYFFCKTLVLFTPIYFKTTNQSKY